MTHLQPGVVGNELDADFWFDWSSSADASGRTEICTIFGSPGCKLQSRRDDLSSRTLPRWKRRMKW